MSDSLLPSKILGGDLRRRRLPNQLHVAPSIGLILVIGPLAAIRSHSKPFAANSSPPIKPYYVVVHIRPSSSDIALALPKQPQWALAHSPPSQPLDSKLHYIF